MRMNRQWMIYLIPAFLSCIYVFAWSGLDFHFVIPKRLTQLAAIILGGSCVAISSIVFQTLTGNRILTPSIMGYEAVYLLWQSLLLLLSGTIGLVALGVAGNFLISGLLILSYSWLLQRWLFHRSNTDIYQLLLFGLVLTMVITTFAQFIQLRISPGEFAVFQGFSHTSFNRAQPETLLIAGLVVTVVCLLGRKKLSTLDVLGLGRDQAISLGVDYSLSVKQCFAAIAFLVAVSTSLIGPTAFLGIFVANIAYAIAPGCKHNVTLPLGCAIAITLFITTQLLVEHVFNYKTTVSILVNILCVGYILMLMTRFRSSL